MAYPAPLADLVAKVTKVKADWGNAVRDRLVHRFASSQDRDSALGAGAPGQVAFTANDDVLQVRSSDRWNLLQFSAGLLNLITTRLFVNGGGTNQQTSLNVQGTAFMERTRGPGGGGVWSSAQVIVRDGGSAAGGGPNGTTSVAFWTANLAPQIMVWEGGGSRFQFVDSSNTVYVALLAASFNVPSADRFKDDLAAADPLDDFDALEVVGWLPKAALRDDGTPEPVDGRRLGFRAVNVAQIAPEAAIRDEKGEPLAVDLTGLLALTVREVQSLRARLATLEAE